MIFRGIQISITGEIETVDDNGLKDKMYEYPTRQFLRE